MEHYHSKKTIISSLFWKFMERSGTQGIQLVIQIVLARLLLPTDFGTIAIVMVFISLAQVFVQSSFNTALIQKKEVDKEDFSSVLFISLMLSSLLYLIIFISAPIISRFYRDAILVPVLRVLALTVFFGAFNSIQNALVARNMMFKKLFYSSLGAGLISGFIGIIVAYYGGGIWALVAQQLVNQIIITVIMWFTIKWRPALMFSFKKIRSLFSFGWKILVSSLLNQLYMEIRTLIIGRIYTSSTLGYYNRGQLFPKVLVTNMDGSIQSVMLSALSANQDNREKVKGLMRRAIVSSSFIIFPMMIGMAMVAEPLVKIVLTDKWLESVPFLQIFCISYALTPIHTANLQAINAMGRSDIYLKLEIFKKIIGIIILGITLPLGVYAIAIGQIISGIIATFINAYPNKQLLDYSYIEQWIDIMPSLFISIVMGGIVYILNFLGLSPLLTLTLQVCIGIVVYIGLAKLTKIESYSYLVSTIKEFI